MSAPVLSWLFTAQGKPRKAFLVRQFSPCANPLSTRRRQVASAQLEHQNKDPYTQPSEPILFPKLRIYFADFPYLHYSSWPEAANLGDLMRLWVRPGVKLSHLGFQGPSRAHLTPRKARRSSRRAALARDNPISGPLAC